MNILDLRKNLKKRPRKSQIPIGFDDYQIENMSVILEFEHISSYGELIRKTFDFYVKSNYPQLMSESADV